MATKGIREKNIELIETIFKKHPEITYDKLVEILSHKLKELTIANYVWIIYRKHLRLNNGDEDKVKLPVTTADIPKTVKESLWRRRHYM